MNTKRKLYLLVSLITVILFFAWRFWRASNVPMQNEPSVPMATNSVATDLPSNLPTANLTTAAFSNLSTTNLSDMYKAYQQGKINKGQMMATIWKAENAQPQDFYGRVIDQYNQPVVRASVNGDLMFIQGSDVGEKKEVHTTETDANGEFEFTGLHGWELAIAPSKPGYELAPNTTAMQLPQGSKTSSFNRAIFIMWKLKGAEPMIHVKAQAGVACDGNPTSFDFLTGKKNANGDLIVNLTRNPVDIVRGKPFDWSITLQIPNGGLLEMTDLYPNEAPVDGYQPSITIDFPANMPEWTAWLNRTFYFKSRDGQIYGRMTISVTADFQPPPTFFSADIYANSAGSRNLEFDPAKQVR